MKPFTVAVGEPLSASKLYHRGFAGVMAERRVGGRPWTCKPAERCFALLITHADAAGKPITYAVPMAFTLLPFGGRRRRWRCPECDRLTDHLYLPRDRDRLACRWCCGLRYRSQYAKAAYRRSKVRGVSRPDPNNNWVNRRPSFRWIGR